MKTIKFWSFGILLSAAAAFSCPSQTLCAEVETRAQVPLFQETDTSEVEAGDARILYGIGSTSKMVTAAAVMKLSEEGTIDLDEPLTTYLPEFWMRDPAYQEITPRMLLDHSSGLQGSTLDRAMIFGKPDTYNHDTLLASLRNQRLKARPGAFATYCNDGFSLAEILVERVSGLSFTEYIEREFSKPLGLTDIATPQTPGLHSRLAAVYDTHTKKQLPPEMANVIGSGGIYGTAADVCGFSQLFMDEPGRAGAVLSREAVREMEESEYDREFNPLGYDSTLSYGFGWDSVRTYPFERYGIKALVKGGDTSCYHASLIVLPQENISCAVLSSGGLSVQNQLAAQEILLAYLEETGRISRDKEQEMSEKPTSPAGDKTDMKPDWDAASGWYIGNALFRLSKPEDNKVTLTRVEGEEERSQTYEIGQDGRLYSTKTGYISVEGSLTKGGNGRVGKSFLEIRTTEEGRRYLMAGTHERFPGLGSTAAYLPVAQALDLPAEENQSSARLEKSGDVWSAWSGKEFYLASEPGASTAYLTRAVMKLFVVEAGESYLLFKDSEFPAAKLYKDNTARFFQQIPGQMGRDLKDYTLIERNGNMYLDAGDCQYLSEDDLKPLPGLERSIYSSSREEDKKDAGRPMTGSRRAADSVYLDEVETVRIGEDGMALWYGWEHGKTAGAVSITAPPDGAWYLYDHSGGTMKCVMNSLTANKGEEILLPDDGRIVFAGDIGAQFTIRFQPVTLWQRAERVSR